MFYSVSSYAQHIIRVHDKATNTWFRIKAGVTNVTFLAKGENKKVKVNGVIDSIDANGIYVRDQGFLRFSKIVSITFKDHWEAVKVVDAVYFTATINLLAYSVYSYVPAYGNPGPTLLIITFPFWAGAIPGLYHLLFYLSRPIATIYEIDYSTFEIKK